MKKIACLVLVILFSAALVSCSLHRIKTAMGLEAGYDNPHTACAKCHGVQKPQAGKALFPPQTEPSEVCLDCHYYAENHHPINIVPGKPVNPSFPLYQGQLKCLSCHEIHGGPWHEGSAKQLRGGPYADRRKFCFDCHTNEQYEDIDPHIMLDKNGKILDVNGKPVCLLCHEVKPDPTRDTAENVLLKADIGFLCERCHPPMAGTLLDKHFRVRPSETTMSYMSRPEFQEKFALPLAPWGRITCSTCHNPHEAGVILRQPAAAGAGAYQKLRAANICEGCHEVY